MAEKAEKYICTKSWARNQAGDEISRYLYNKYPVEIQTGNFKPIEVKPVVAPKAAFTSPKSSSTEVAK